MSNIMHCNFKKYFIFCIVFILCLGLITGCKKTTKTQQKVTSIQNEETEKIGMNNKLVITVGDYKMTATLVQNSSVDALVEALKKEPITYEAHDYGNFEKVGSLGKDFPQNNEYITTKPGDIILYQGKNLCIYYGQNSWDFTRIGRIDSISQSELKKILGSGNVTVTLSLK